MRYLLTVLGTLAGAALRTFAVVGFLRTAATWIALDWLTAPQPPSDDPLEPLVVLLPALREQGLVVETLDWFESLDYPADLFKIVVITTERESLETESVLRELSSPDSSISVRLVAGHWPSEVSQQLPRDVLEDLELRRSELSQVDFRSVVKSAIAKSPSTGELVSVRAERSTQVHCVEAPLTWERKAGQLRYAVSRIDTILAGWEALESCQYIGVYDFDARPDRGALLAASAAAQSRALLLQQPGLTVPRMGASRKQSKPADFATLDGQLHSRLAARLELASLLLDRRLRRLAPVLRALLGSSVHTVGNGLFFDRDRLDRLGGLPRVVDDLALGWRATAIGEAVEPIRSVVFYDAYPSAAAASKSREFICSGYLRAVADIREAPARVTVAFPIHLFRIYQRLAQWTVGPYVRGVVLLAGFRIRPRLTICASVILYATFWVDIRHVHRAWRLLGRPTVTDGFGGVISSLAAPVALVWYGQGARRAIFKSVVGAARKQIGTLGP